MPGGKAKTLTQHETSEAPIDSERPHLEERVLDYFHRNSHAMDSVDGVARFWVGENHGLVERCLVDLHGRGLLQKRTIAGTDFYSLLQELQRPTPQQSRPAADSQAQACGRILIAAADASIRSFMMGALSEEGHSVAVAENGDRAIEMFRADPSDLVVTDLLMPGCTGIEVLQAVKDHCPSTEVIVVTAQADLEAAIDALRHGAYEVITKPLDDIQLLYQAVERALQKQRLSMDNFFLVDTLQARNLELKETVARLAAVNEIGKAMTGLMDLHEIYDTVVRMVAQHLKVRRVSVLVAEPDSDTMSLVASVGIAEQEARNQRVQVGEGIAGRVAATQSPLLVTNIEKSDLRDLRSGGRYTTPSFIVTPLSVSYPMHYQHKRVGVINASDKHSGDPFDEQDLEFLSALSSQVAVAIEHARLVKDLEDGYLVILVSLIQAAEDSRPETRGHSRRVTELATAMAEAMELPDSRVRLLKRAAALHEVGRLSTPTEDGAGATPTTFMATERILAPIASLRGVRELVLHAADGFDDSGSVFGVSRIGTPLESRILAVCEEFVRRTPGTDRDPEKQRQALETLRNQAGHKHDPQIVAALCQLVEAGEVR
jgi:response regulator RpfG family c-di-GMP phosphodiesterase